MSESKTPAKTPAKKAEPKAEKTDDTAKVIATMSDTMKDTLRRVEAKEDALPSRVRALISRKLAEGTEYEPKITTLGRKVHKVVNG